MAFVLLLTGASLAEPVGLSDALTKVNMVWNSIFKKRECLSVILSDPFILIWISQSGMTGMNLPVIFPRWLCWYKVEVGFKSVIHFVDEIQRLALWRCAAVSHTESCLEGISGKKNIHEIGGEISCAGDRLMSSLRALWYWRMALDTMLLSNETWACVSNHFLSSWRFLKQALPCLYIWFSLLGFMEYQPL